MSDKYWAISGAMTNIKSQMENGKCSSFLGFSSSVPNAWSYCRMMFLDGFAAAPYQTAAKSAGKAHRKADSATYARL
jgi:hypothetical protein